MKLGEAKQSTEAGERKLYTGVAPLQVICVNPDKAEMEEKLGWKIQDEPVYTGEKDGVQWVSVIFYTKPVTEGMDNIIIPLRFYMRNEIRMSTNKGKGQLINLYGETCWITAEELEKGEFNPTDYFAEDGARPALSGEDSLVEFIRTYLSVPSRRFYDSNTKGWEEIEDPEMAASMFENPEKFFTGDISEIQQCIDMFPENKVKVWLGVQRTNDNKLYQTFFPSRFAKYSSRSIDGIRNAISKAEEAGMYGNVEFGKEEFKEYSETPTEIAPAKAVSVNEVKNKWLKK